MVDLEDPQATQQVVPAVGERVQTAPRITYWPTPLAAACSTMSSVNRARTHIQRLKASR
ncbi:MAG TPA: hypothetical protein VHS30_03410 [Streptosporangiaceae bacterium]|nr:hypothetical protein [Streptosporangiaceae bacterium]